VRSECKRLRTGQASLLDRPVREDMEQHVDSTAKKGVSVELLHHIAHHLKDELQELQSEEVGWTLVAIHVWIEQRRLSRMVLLEDFLMDNACISLHGCLYIHCCNVGDGSILGFRTM
jgi:hypothetical protein